MRLQKISVMVIVFTFTICLAFSWWSLALAACPLDHPVDCGDFCCPYDFLDCEEQIVEEMCVAPIEAGCFSEEIYGENSKEVVILRYLRDNVLGQTSTGQELIRLYYEWSPAIVKTMENDEEFKEAVKEIIDGIMLLVEGKI